jgi:hypothetical protein
LYCGGQGLAVYTNNMLAYPFGIDSIWLIHILSSTPFNRYVIKIPARKLYDDSLTVSAQGLRFNYAFVKEHTGRDKNKPCAAI